MFGVVVDAVGATIDVGIAPKGAGHQTASRVHCGLQVPLSQVVVYAASQTVALMPATIGLSGPLVRSICSLILPTASFPSRIEFTIQSRRLESTRSETSIQRQPELRSFL